MLEGIVRDTVTLLNFLPSTEVDRSSPRTIIDGERLNYRRWSRFSAGQAGEFEILYRDKSAGARKELGYILCHQGDNAVVRLLPSGRRAVVRSAHFTPLEKSTAITKLIEDGISEAQKQKFNDLLSEISDFYGVEDATRIEHDTHLNPLTLAPEQQSSTDEHAQDHNEMPVEEPFNFFGTPAQSERGEAPASPGASHQPVDVHHQDTTMEEPPSPPAASTTPTLRRSQRSSAWKPPGFYADSTEAESVREYIACHMSAQECAAIYGKAVQEAAGSDEVINIVGRGALFPRNWRELSREELQRILPSFLFYKAKDLLPSEAAQDDARNLTWTTVESKRDKKANKKKKKRVKVKGRWVGGGHKQKKNEALKDRVDGNREVQ